MTTPRGRRAMAAAETDEAYLYLVTLDHDSLDAPLRFVAALRENQTDIVSRGNAYIAYPFAIAFPNSEDGSRARTRVRITAVSDPEHPENDVVLILRNLQGDPPTITLETVLYRQPDEVERQAPDMVLEEVTTDRLVIEGSLAYEDVLTQRFPKDDYIPSKWPGAFSA
jgi:hypothetical protein